MSGGIDLPSDAGWWAAGLSLIGSAFAWLWTAAAKRGDSFYQKNLAHEKRLHEKDAELREREDTLDAAVKDRLTKLENSYESLLTSHRVIVLQHERFKLGLILLAQETHATNPASTALMQVRALLGAAFPLDLDNPPEIAAAIDALSRSRSEAA